MRKEVNYGTWKHVNNYNRVVNVGQTLGPTLRCHVTVGGVNYAKVVLIFLLLQMIKLLVCGVCYCESANVLWSFPF